MALEKTCMSYKMVFAVPKTFYFSRVNNSYFIFTCLIKYVFVLYYYIQNLKLESICYVRSSRYILKSFLSEFMICLKITDISIILIK